MSDLPTALRILFIGDVMGRSGRAAIARYIPQLREKWTLDFIIVNGENAAGGFGITESICEEMLSCGVDCITLGNHAFDQREALAGGSCIAVRFRLRDGCGRQQKRGGQDAGE